MKTSWFKGLDEKGEADIKSAFKSSLTLRERLKELCEEKKESSLSTNKKQYENPNWAYMQADDLGYRRALNEIISLLED